MNGTFPEGNRAGWALNAAFEEIHERGQGVQAVFRVWANRFRSFGRSAKEKFHFWLLPILVSPVELFHQ
jgi:hypothetical protein